MYQLHGVNSDRLRKQGVREPMGKADQPRTGDGKKGSHKPAKTQVTMRTESGTTLWKATVNLFTRRGKGQKGGR